MINSHWVGQLQICAVSWHGIDWMAIYAHCHDMALVKLLFIYIFMTWRKQGFHLGAVSTYGID